MVFSLNIRRPNSPRSTSPTRYTFQYPSLISSQLKHCISVAEHGARTSECSAFVVGMAKEIFANQESGTGVSPKGAPEKDAVSAIGLQTAVPEITKKNACSENEEQKQPQQLIADPTDEISRKEDEAVPRIEITSYQPEAIVISSDFKFSRKR